MPQGVEDPTFNPFDDELEALSSPVIPASHPIPNYNAGSKGNNKLTILTDPQSTSRAQESPSQHHHPLRSAGSLNGFQDVGVTRPHLNRALTGKLIDLGEESESENVEVVHETEEETVLVHQVAPKDSLAGVALKYGISLAELRRANHLWFSDSIHLRKELYIPLNKTSQSLSAPGGQQAPKSPVEATLPADKNSKYSTSTIRRIPAKQLSFFPPPTKPVPSPSDSQHSSIEVVDLPKSHHSRYASTPSASLNTFLTALPIAASTRDTIIARLSFDSPGSSYSDHEQSRQEDHELDDVPVGRSRHVRSFSQDALSEESPSVWPVESATPRLSPAKYAAEPSMRASSRPVRTVQLEPSPTMQMPVLRRVPSRSRTISHSEVSKKPRPKLIDIDFESLDDP
ncbi:hypothetical protein VNI00_008581 [Paramarasmius palmivorus]|uniref:LysM domain-containing protein n=1 Tax=Paramarasmius palmivorus TaxID=297713 RepID=A0AAW0CWA1_9AGAR